MNERRALLAIIDLFLVNVAVLLALAIWALRGDKGWGLDFLAPQSFWFVILSALWLLFAYLSGLYDLRTCGSLHDTVLALVQTVVAVILVYFVIYFLAEPNSLPRLVVIYHGAATIALIGLWRVAYGGFTSQAPFRRRALIVGAGWAGRTIACEIHAHAGSHYQVVGFVDDDPEKQGQSIEGIPVVGTRERLVCLVRERNVAEVVLAISRDLSPEMFRMLLDVQEQGVQITPMSVLYEQITSRLPVEHIGDSWYVALPLGHAATGSVYPLVKRLLDLIVAAVGLVVFGVMLPIVALAIRLDSPGPIFYWQERVGKGGKVFRVRKLRSMRSDAEPEGRAIWAKNGDPRVTRVGRFLRKARIDEFPQFLNILKGEMSAVGPRPERPEFVAKFEKSVPFYRLRHAVRPGMAGWAVVNFGYVDSIESALVRTEYDLYYIKHQSLWLDILILFRTMGQVFALRGR